MADFNESVVRYVLDDAIGGNESMGNVSDYAPVGVRPLTMVFATLYGLICAVGLLGNGLVIFVVLRYTKMKTVTNMYILNLAIADLCFLIGLPFLIATSIMRTWVFGYAFCKLFYIQTSINWFTSVFTLTVMSADRYVAICHPVRSISYRTPVMSRVVCACVWTVSLLAMLPIILYATTQTDHGVTSCTIIWPDGQLITAEKAFIWYALLLGFAVPVALICVFYALVLLRLQTVGPTRRSKEKRRSHRRVTKMVLTVIVVYIVCWLPYWVFQVVLTFADDRFMPPRWSIQLFQVITVMSYANSMLNPLLYAFLSDNFRKSFIKAFECATKAEVNGSLHADHSVFPGRRKSTLVTTAHTGTRGRALPAAESHEAIECLHTATTNVSTSGGATTGGCLDDKVAPSISSYTNSQNGGRLSAPAFL